MLLFTSRYENYNNFQFHVKKYLKKIFSYQGYGLTETTSTAAITEEDDISLGKVGAPLQGINNNFQFHEKNNNSKS